ncbi:MAG: glycosyl transferase [Phycisphaerae bacterium]|nr:MAG: glycosyl transferase [Phycisphaerae bacterium]
MSSIVNASRPKKSGPNSDQTKPVLFEIAWEVCNQVGGIYTVLRSKAAVTTEDWGDRYCLIGPYVEEKAAVEFEELELGPTLGKTIETLRATGMKIHYGRWLVTGNPRVLLIDVGASAHKLDEFRHSFWTDCQINYPDGDTETNDCVSFGYLLAQFFEALSKQLNNRRPIIAQFHEWLAGAAIPIIKKRELPVATIFTTHATLLGRYLCASTQNFYERLPWINPDQEAGDRQIYHRYCIERAAAHGADVFTTVSDITAIEADHLLKRRPEKVLPNGLRVEKFAAIHEFQNLHREAKEKIHHFTQAHFFRSSPFDLDKTIYMFTSGRYEYHNKGIDVFIEGLSRLNNHLMHAGSDVTVVAFIVTAAPTHHLNIKVLQNHSMLAELKSCCEDVARSFQKRLFDATARGELPPTEDLLSNDEIVILKRLLHSRSQTELPPIVTHHMVDDAADPVLAHLRHRHLFNNKHDRVKVVFHPEFINRTNPLFSMDYPEFVRGCHLGVFPSYYEPWGYTPAECAVMGIPSVCTDLSGFGAFMQAKFSDHDENGIFVLKRRHCDSESSIDQLADIMIRFCALDRRQRVQLRNRVERLAQCLDWTELNPAYEEARALAMQRAYGEAAVKQH